MLLLLWISRILRQRSLWSADRKKELSSQEEVKQLLYIAEQYLAKQLSSTEVNHILYFYDELHFSSDLIEYLIGILRLQGKTQHKLYS